MIPESIKHWLKIDHITFLLIAPAIIFGFQTTALLLWAIALLYDAHEQIKKKKENESKGDTNYVP